MPILTRSQRKKANNSNDDRSDRTVKRKRRRQLSNKIESKPIKRARINRYNRININPNEYSKYYCLHENESLKYDINIYKNQTIAKSVQCSVCLGVCNNAMYVGCTSRHKICSTCLNNIYAHADMDELEPQCPECREELCEYSHNERVPFRLINEIVSNLDITCPNESLNNDKNVDFQCNWEGKLCEFSEHNILCNKRKGKCKNCGKEMYQKHFMNHLQKCFIKCKLCGLIIGKKVYDSHTKYTCPDILKKCDKCNKYFKQKVINEHQKNLCPKRTYNCRICNVDVLVLDKEKHIKKNIEKHLRYEINTLRTRLDTMIDDLNYLRNGITLNDILLNEFELKNLQNNNELDIRESNGKWIRVFIIKNDNYIEYSKNKDRLGWEYNIFQRININDKHRFARPGSITERGIHLNNMKSLNIGDKILINCDLNNVCNEHNGWQNGKIDAFDDDSYQIKCSFYCISCETNIDCGWFHPDMYKQIKPL